MNGGKNRLSYWDSGIFLAWLTNESRSEEDTLGIRHLIDGFSTGKGLIFASTILLAEVLDARLSEKSRDLFRGLRANRSFHFIDVTIPTAARAAEIRYYYSNKSDGLPGLSTPDAIHLATATVHRCDVFYTFDGADKPGKQRGLLPLNEYFYGTYGLRIERPRPEGQIALELC